MQSGNHFRYLPGSACSQECDTVSGVCPDGAEQFAVLHLCLKSNLETLRQFLWKKISLLF